MPHRHAAYYLLLLFPLAGLAFYPQYLAQFATSSVEMHAHGVTATLWLMLLVTQSWTIHNGGRRWHRTLGLASLVLFPLFLAGGTGIWIGMARRFAEGATPFHAMYAPRLAWLDMVSVAGFAWFYFEGLRSRRNAHQHARWLTATALFLLPPVLGRLSGLLPGLSMAGPQDLWKAGIGFQFANAVTIAIAVLLALRGRPHGRPYWLAAALTLVAAVAFATVGAAPAWEALFARSADAPWPFVALTALLAGALISYAGWRAGARPPVQRNRADALAGASAA